MFKKTCIAALLAASVGPAAAEDTDGFLFGIGAGQVNYDVSELGIDEDSDAWKVVAGYRFNENFTTEIAYIDGGEVGGNVAGVGVRAEGDVLQLSATGGWWFTDSFGAYVRAAWDSWETTATASAFGRTAAITDEGDDFGYGIGLQALWDRALWRLEYETADMDGSDVRIITLNIGWQF
jgi:OOP family OmpA-OmpF porin